MTRRMQPVNLASVITAHKNLSDTNRDNLFKAWGISPKQKELVSLEALIDGISKLAPYSPEIVTGMMGECFFGFVIPRISKEFDCLWIGDKTIVNLELKSQDVGTDAIKKQLVKNRHYLQALGKVVRSFTFDSSTDCCYTIDSQENIVNCKLQAIAVAIYQIHKENLFVDDVELLFPPERYLVSPFNSTDAFLKKQYFLTHQQEEIKKKILQFIEDPTSGCFSAITGGPGSGKTLLLYDIAQALMDVGKNVLIAHAGGLNTGHNQLINNGWQIVATKYLMNVLPNDERELRDADVYLFDETQRCYGYIVNAVIEEVVKKGKKCIFSLDAEQIMSDGEKRYNNEDKIRNACGKNYYTLTSNIRTNDDVYSFVKALFDKHHPASANIRGHVELIYCQTVGETVAMLTSLKKKGLQVPTFTPILHGKANYEDWFPTGLLSAHQVIGQEFDDVVGLISENMYYDANGKLVSKANYLYREEVPRGQVSGMRKRQSCNFHF